MEVVAPAGIALKITDMPEIMGAGRKTSKTPITKRGISTRRIKV
jgi:hypothetical protein